MSQLNAAGEVEPYRRAPTHSAHRLSAARHLRRIDLPVPPPPRRQKPHPRCHHRPIPGPCPPPPPATEPIEKRRRRARINHRRRPSAARLGRVPMRLKQHIRERITRLPRRLELPRMIPVREHSPPPPEHPIQLPRDPNREPLHPRRQRPLVRSLDDQMEMVRLHRILNQPKPTPLPPFAKRAPKDVHTPLGPEVRHRARDPKREMRRRPTVERGPRLVAQPRARGPLSAGTFASASPGAEGELLLARLSGRHMNEHNLIPLRNMSRRLL